MTAFRVRCGKRGCAGTCGLVVLPRVISLDERRSSCGLSALGSAEACTGGNRLVETPGRILMIGSGWAVTLVRATMCEGVN